MINSLKIGIDIKSGLDVRRSGIGNYVYHLVKNLLSIDKNNKYYFYSTGKSFEDFNRENVVFLNRKNPLSLFNNFDVFHGPDFKLLPVRAKKKIVTIHDLASFKNEDFMAENFKLLTRKKIKQSVQRADIIVTISNSIKNDILKYLNVEKSKVKVVYIGVNESTLTKKENLDRSDIEKTLKKYGINRPYFLFVGNLELRKNVQGLIKSFAFFREKYKTNHQLVLTGKAGYGYEKIKYELDRNPFRNDIIETGWISDFDLSVLLSGAELYIYLSLYEGFGFPILEAMLFSLPVICSDIPVLKEIAENSAFFVNPLSPENVSDSIHRLLSDSSLKSKLIKNGLETAAYFSWEKAAGKMIEIYES